MKPIVGEVDGNFGYDEYARNRPGRGAVMEATEGLKEAVDRSNANIGMGAIACGGFGFPSGFPGGGMGIPGVAIGGTPLTDSKPTNPKDAIGIAKLPLHLVSPIVKAYAAIAHFLGNVKYGAWNWRAGGARVSVYVSALARHIDRYWEGEWYDPEDGTPHLANALACINILIETHHKKNITDDRPAHSTDLGPLYKEFEALMAKIKVKYVNKNPHHHTKDQE